MKTRWMVSFYRSQSGLSLIEAMVGMLVITIMGLALSTMIVSTNRQTKQAALRVDGISLANEITALLSDPATCKHNFLNKSYQSLDESQILSLQTTTSIKVFEKYDEPPGMSEEEKAKQKLGMTKFKILGMSINQNEIEGTAANAAKQITYLVVRYEMGKLNSAEANVDKNREMRQLIKLSYVSTAPNLIASCRSLGGITDTWSRPLTVGTLNNLFYDGGMVGIGTNSPQSAFHLHSAPSTNAGTAHIRLTNTATGNLSYLASDENGFTRLAGNAGVGFGYTDGTGFTEVIRASSTGRVGIGTDDPTQLLEVRAPAGSTSGYIYNNKEDGGLLMGTNGVESRGGIGLANAAGRWSVDSAAGDVVLRALQGGNLTFATSAGLAAATSTKLKVMNNGNVGVGTTNPSWLLHVEKSSPGSNTRAAVVNSATGAGTSADLVVSTGTANSYTGLLQFDGASPYTQIVGGPANTGGFYLDQQANAPMIFRVNASAERMRINANGFVGIGTTNPQAPLEVSGGVRLANSSTCDAAREGTIRYRSASKAVEFCDGINWVTMVKPAEMCTSVGGIWNPTTEKCSGPGSSESCPLSLTDVPAGIPLTSAKCRKPIPEKLKVEEVPLGERSSYVWYCNSVWTGSGFREYDATKVTSANNCVTAGKFVIADAGTPIPPGYTCGGAPSATAINPNCGYYSCLSGAIVYQPACPGGEIGGGGSEGSSGGPTE